MGLLHTGMTILHFDDTYYAQEKLFNYPHEDINLKQMKHVNLYCEHKSLTTLSKKLARHKQTGITYIGSGNYHYMTYLLLKKISHPFTLVLFDHHPDIATEQDHHNRILSCGSWVSNALSELPLLQKVVIIGPTMKTIQHYIRHPRVELFPFERIQNFSLKTIQSAVPTKHIYISIDKDVLASSEVVTNWDHGKMSLDLLTKYLESFIREKQVEGVDVCGEIPTPPHFRLLPELSASIRKNEQANLMIRQACFNTNHHSLGA